MATMMTVNRKALEGQTEKMHAKTFSAWINHQLEANKSPLITDLVVDFKDGVHLIHLLEIIFKKPIGKKYNPHPNNDNHRIDNVALAIDFMKQNDFAANINSKDVVDGNAKLLLGLVWKMIVTFQILKPGSGDSDAQKNSGSDKLAKKNLLQFCQEKTKGYEGVDVDDLSWSFHDGKAFCALIHAINPALINWDEVKNATDLENLERAFKAAESLGIPRLLDVNDMANEDIEMRPDERCIMTYLSEFPIAYVNNKQPEKQVVVEKVEVVVVDQEAIEKEKKLQEELAAKAEALQKLEQEKLEKEKAEKELQANLDKAEKEKLEMLKKQQELEEMTKKLEQMRLQQEEAQKMQDEMRKKLEDDERKRKEQEKALADAKKAEEDRRAQEEIEALRNKVKDLESKLIGKLKVTIVEAKNLKSELLGTNPFVRLKLDTQEYKTAVKSGSNPKFDQQFELFTSDSRSELTLAVWAQHTILKDKMLGHASVPVSELAQKEGENLTIWVPLKAIKNEPVSGEILLEVKFSKGK